MVEIFVEAFAKISIYRIIFQQTFSSDVLLVGKWTDFELFWQVIYQGHSSWRHTELETVSQKINAKSKDNFWTWPVLASILLKWVHIGRIWLSSIISRSRFSCSCSSNSRCKDKCWAL